MADVSPPFPQSVLFCCDHNAVRSPMAEGLMKLLYGQRAYVQSAGIKHDLEIDGFAIAVCDELGVKLEQHRTRSFEEMEEGGEELSGFDLIIALSPASHQMAQELIRGYHIDLEYWPIMDPTGVGTTRDQKLESYRQARDQIKANLLKRFGPSERER